MNALPQTFDPVEVDPSAYRAALGQFATGVTIVTCQSPTGPLGMTANSFASVSLDPPLVLWSPAKGSKRHEAFTQATHFAIHVASAEQIDLCAHFAKDGTNFSDVAWEQNAQNVPILPGCLSLFECETSAIHDGGDHSIIVGRVTRVTTQNGSPLVFSGGRYGGFKGAS